MPILAHAKEALQRRYINNNNCYGSNDYNCGYSGWGNYGRWILLAAIVVAAFFIFLIFSCITARRRRRNGMQPFRGTGWAGGPPRYGESNQQYAAQSVPYQGNQGGNQGWSQPPPQYGQQPQDSSYYGGQAPKPAYDGGQQNGVELQQPQQAYQPQREDVYATPEGPPPGHKSDGIVR